MVNTNYKGENSKHQQKTNHTLQQVAENYQPGDSPKQHKYSAKGVKEMRLHTSTTRQCSCLLHFTASFHLPVKHQIILPPRPTDKPDVVADYLRTLTDITFNTLVLSMGNETLLTVDT
jgi:hypothetical protein